MASTFAEISIKFKQVMQKGNIKAALNLLTNHMSHGILQLDQKTISQHLLKHPQKSCVSKGYFNQWTNKERSPSSI